MSSILFLGTASGAGKTTLTALYCRHLVKQGLTVAPFKVSNLSLNSYVTTDGAEIGMGQAFQAWACGHEPTADMNPILLKPTGKGTLQLILKGRPLLDLDEEHPLNRTAMMKEAGACYDRLLAQYGNIVCEGSGSPAEINLQNTDLANVGLLRARPMPTVLIGDIERGGVFAAIYGTWRLLPDDVRPLLRGFIINRFRGDTALLDSGIERIKQLTGMKCLGIVPYEALRFPEEDSFAKTDGILGKGDLHQAFVANLDVLLEKCQSLDFTALDTLARSSSA